LIRSQQVGFCRQTSLAAIDRHRDIADSRHLSAGKD
jgi:hypothetical protein